MPKAYKGSEFEREMCKCLSLWWTDSKRDDVFWRSAQSGGRATERTKKGKTTYGSYGDIAAVDPIGEPLLKFATIELKRGSSHGVPWDLFESSDSKAVRPFESALEQARTSALQAGSLGWMLIARRDRKRAIVYMGWHLYRKLGQRIMPAIIYHLTINFSDDFPAQLRFVAIRLEDWFMNVRPQQIIECMEREA